MRVFLLGLLACSLQAQNPALFPMVADTAQARRVPGYTAVAPLEMEKSASFTLTLAEQTPAAYLEVAIEDPMAEVAITAPNGTHLTGQYDASEGIYFFEHADPITKVRHGKPYTTGGASTTVSFGAAPAGEYKVEISRSAPGKVWVRAQLFPLMRISENALDIDDELAYTLGADGSGPALLVPYSPQGPFLVGEPFEVKFKLVGGPLESPKFAAKVLGRVALTPFALGADGFYRATATPARSEHVEIRVLVTGRLYEEEKALLNDKVLPRVATLTSLSLKPVGRNQDGVFEGIEAEAVLNIANPGSYSMTFRAGLGPKVEVEKQLAAGRQIISQLLTPDQFLPAFTETVEIADLEIVRKDNPDLPVSVRGWTARLKLDPAMKWDDRWPYGAPRAALHSVYPAPSGRFRFLEAEREVVTNGGTCSWMAYLRPRGSNIALSASARLKLPPGRQVVHLIFDGREIPNFSQNQYVLTLTSAGCGPPGVERPWLESSVSIDPAQYEGSSDALKVHLNNAVVQLQQGYEEGVWVQSEVPIERLQWSATGGLPEGVEFVAERHAFHVQRDAGLGRSVVVLSVRDGNRVATLPMLLDVLPAH